MSGRTPVVIYEPLGNRRLLNSIRDWYPQDQILEVAGTLEQFENLPLFVYTSNPLRKMPHIPMLISAAGLLFSGPQQLMIQRAGKVVYSAADVYTNSKRKVTKIAS